MKNTMNQLSAPKFPKTAVALKRLDFKSKKAKAEADGYTVLPSVNGPYIWDSVADKYIGML